MSTTAQRCVLVPLLSAILVLIGCGSDGGSSGPVAPASGDSGIAAQEDAAGPAFDSGAEDVLRRDSGEPSEDAAGDGEGDGAQTGDVAQTYPPLSTVQADASFQPQEIALVDVSLPLAPGQPFEVALDGTAVDAVSVGSSRIAFVVPSLASGEYRVDGGGLPSGLVLYVEEPVDVIAADGRTAREIIEQFRDGAVSEYADALADDEFVEEFPELAAQLAAEAEATVSAIEDASEEERVEFARYILLNADPLATEKWNPSGCFDISSYVVEQQSRIVRAVVLTLAAGVMTGPLGGAVVGVATFGYLAYRVYEYGDGYILDCYEPIFSELDVDAKSEHSHVFVSGVRQDVVPSLRVELREEDAADAFLQFRALIAEYGALFPGDLVTAWLSMPTETFQLMNPDWSGFYVDNVSDPDIHSTLVSFEDGAELEFFMDEDLFEDREFTFELVYHGRCQFLACKTPLEFRLEVHALLTSSCGNGVVDDWEACDPGASVAATCAEITPGTDGTVTCTDSCTFDASACATVCPRADGCRPPTYSRWVYTDDGVESLPVECRWGGIIECVEVNVEGCEPVMMYSAGLPCGDFCDDGSVPVPDMEGATTYGIICHDGLEGRPCNEQFQACDSEAGFRCDHHIDYRDGARETRACTSTEVARNCDTDGDGELEPSDNACFSDEVCLQTPRGFLPPSVLRACYPSGSTECRAAAGDPTYDEGTMMNVCMPETECMTHDVYLGRSGGEEVYGTSTRCYPTGSVICDPNPSDRANAICPAGTSCFRDDRNVTFNHTSASCIGPDREPVQCNVRGNYWVCQGGNRCDTSSPYVCRSR